MANRRSGGRPFPQRQGFQGNGLSPWQSPPNSMNQGLISNPQQLAMALTSLLQPQQQNPPSLSLLQPQQQNPPSFFLNTSPFTNQNRDFNRFGGNRGFDTRRHEPYNKNGNFKARPQNRNNRLGVQKKKTPYRHEKRHNKQKKEETEKDEEEKETGDGGNKEPKEGPYAGVPVKYLRCFVCGKEMSDAESMNKHVKGRAHMQMLESLDERIHLIINILREHVRFSDERKFRLKRTKRSNKFNYKNRKGDIYCNTCDLKKISITLDAHRKTNGHQRLMRYQHPKCVICDKKEFPSRIACVKHHLTPDHLKKLHESDQEKEGGESKEGDIFNVDEPDLETLLEESIEMEAESPIFELTDDLPGLGNIPVYKPDRPVSTKSLHPFTGIRCEICRRSFQDEDLAQTHLMTRRHYYAFIQAVKRKYKQEQAKKPKVEEVKKEPEAEKAETTENGDADMLDPEETCNENGENKDTSMEVDDETAEGITDEQKAELLGEEEEEVEEEKEEQKVEIKKPATKPARVAASTPARPMRTVAGSVKNGAGPKSKKAQK